MKNRAPALCKRLATMLVVLTVFSLTACSFFDTLFGNDNNKPPHSDPESPSAPVTVTLAYTVSGGGTISGDAVQTVESGRNGREVEAVPESGYTFLGWTDGVMTAKRSDTAGDENATYTAKFVGSTISVTYTSNNYNASNLAKSVVRTADADQTVSVTVTPKRGHKFVEWSDGVTTPTRTDDAWLDGETVQAIFAPDALNLPIVQIDTLGAEAPTVQSKDYVPCTITVGNTDEAFCVEKQSAGIRVRGNTTARYIKKPYRIKFDKKIALFGSENKYKSWCLLALYQDFSDIKDYTAFKIARDIGTGNFVPSTVFTEVYCNGEYKGLYLLTDQVDEKEGRLNVETVPDPAVAETSFMAQIDDYCKDEGVEGVNWFSIHVTDYNVDYYVEVQYPEPKDGATNAHFRYVQTYITTVHNLIFDPAVTRAQFEQYVDLPSFIDYYLVQEVMGQAEINNKSIKMSKSASGKLVMGPVWDFDWATGGPMRVNSGMNTTGAYNVSGWLSQSNWFARLIGARSGESGVAWFREAVKARWTQIKPKVLASLDEVAAMKSTLRAAAVRNEALWTQDNRFMSVNSAGVTSYPQVTTDYDAYYDWVLAYIRTKADTMTTLLA